MPVVVNSILTFTQFPLLILLWSPFGDTVQASVKLYHIHVTKPSCMIGALYYSVISLQIYYVEYKILTFLYIHIF